MEKKPYRRSVVLRAKMGTSPDEARGALVSDDVRFDDRDAQLLEAIAEYGSVNRASAELGRSQARAVRRIETLEGAFGDLVERQRGGSGGGGSELTDDGRSVLDRYYRLAAAIDATASVRETVLRGTVTRVYGELADVETSIGAIRGVHEGIEVGEVVQIRIPSDALTVHAAEATPDPNATSARNQRTGRVDVLERGETVHVIAIDVDGTTFRATITQDSLDRLAIDEGDAVSISWKATGTRLIESTR